MSEDSRALAVNAVHDPTAGTCQWFISSAKFLQWSREDDCESKFLWVQGKPGINYHDLFTAAMLDESCPRLNRANLTRFWEVSSVFRRGGTS